MMPQKLRRMRGTFRSATEQSKSTVGRHLFFFKDQSILLSCSRPFFLPLAPSSSPPPNTRPHRQPLGTKRPLEGSAEEAPAGANDGDNKRHQRELSHSPTKSSVAVAAVATEGTQPAAAAAAAPRPPPLGSNDENAPESDAADVADDGDGDGDEDAGGGEEGEGDGDAADDDPDDDDFFDQSLIEGGDRSQKLLARLLKSRRDEARRTAAAAERLEKIARAGAARQEGGRGGRKGGGEAEDEAAAEAAARSAALALVGGAGGGRGSGGGAAEGPDAEIDGDAKPERCWWPPPSSTAKGGGSGSWPNAATDAARLSELGRALLPPSLAREKRGSISTSSDFDEFVSPFVDEEALGRSALVSGLLAAEAAEAAASAAEGEVGGSSSSFISSAAPALVSLALGGNPSLAAPALAALRAAWSLESPWIPYSSSPAAVAVAPPSAGELLRALAAAGVALGGGSMLPEEASPSSSSASPVESRLPGLRLLARTIRAAALACIRSGGKCVSGRNGDASGGSGGGGKGKGKAAAMGNTSSANPFGELPGVELFAALSALRADPAARLAEPELGDAAAAVLGAFLRDPGGFGSGRGDPGSGVARLVRAAAEGALSRAPPCESPAPSAFCARSALEAVRRIPSSASTAAGAGADVVRALSAALVASRLAEARRGGGGGGAERKGGSEARGRSAVAAELALALRPSSSSASSASAAATSRGVLTVAEAAPAAVVAIARKLLEGEWFTLGGAALVRGSPAAAAAAAGGNAAAAAAAAPAPAAQQARAPRTARLLLEAADEALWPAVEAEVSATARRVAEDEEAAAAASAAAAANGEFSPSPPPSFSGGGDSAAPPPRSALAARWLPFVRAVDREAARGRAEPDRLLQLAAASMAQRYSVAAAAARNVLGSGRAAYGRAGAVEMSSPT